MVSKCVITIPFVRLGKLRFRVKVAKCKPVVEFLERSYTKYIVIYKCQYSFYQTKLFFSDDGLRLRPKRQSRNSLV